MDYPSYPPVVAEEVVRLRRRIEYARVPPKVVDRNLLIATWNIRHFGDVYGSFEENPGSPKRNLRGLAHIAEIVQHFDIIALQEVKPDLRGIGLLREWLGDPWRVVMSDVTRGAQGNYERLGFLYDNRRVNPSGLAGELVIPPLESGEPGRQFARTPYAVSFSAGEEEFVLVTLHVLYGDVPADREPELRAIAEWMADWGSDEERYHNDLIVLGDFNVDRTGDPRFEAFTSTGLWVPQAIQGRRTNIFQQNAKHYDQIAWFRGQLQMWPTGNAGVVDFADAVFRELSLRQKSYRVSDHLPLWVEFSIDHSEGDVAENLGVSLGEPDPFSAVPD